MPRFDDANTPVRFHVVSRDAAEAATAIHRQLPPAVMMLEVLLFRLLRARLDA
jgi:hypothetical protein